MKKTFKETLTAIKDSERCKDDFLKAARLQRHERKPRLTSEDFMTVLILGMVLLFILAFFALVVLG